MGENRNNGLEKRQERQQKRQKNRKLRQLNRKARVQARREKWQKQGELRKEFRKEKQGILKDQQNFATEHHSLENERQKELTKQNKEIHSSIKEERQKNWRRYRIRQRRRTKRFMKFRNRVWWKGYLTILGWILLIFVVVLGIFYLFKAMGINLIELLQGNTQPEIIVLKNLVISH